MLHQGGHTRTVVGQSVAGRSPGVVRSVGVDDSSTNQLGGLVAERPARIPFSDWTSTYQNTVLLGILNVQAS